MRISLSTCQKISPNCCAIKVTRKELWESDLIYTLEYVHGFVANLIRERLNAQTSAFKGGVYKKEDRTHNDKS